MQGTSPAQYMSRIQEMSSSIWRQVDFKKRDEFSIMTADIYLFFYNRWSGSHVQLELVKLQHIKELSREGLSNYYLGSWILYEGYAVFLDPLWFDSYTLQGKQLGCLHSGPTLIGYHHKELCSDKETGALQKACLCRGSNMYLVVEKLRKETVNIWCQNIFLLGSYTKENWSYRFVSFFWNDQLLCFLLLEAYLIMASNLLTWTASAKGDLLPPIIS